MRSGRVLLGRATSDMPDNPATLGNFFRIGGDFPAHPLAGQYDPRWKIGAAGRQAAGR